LGHIISVQGITAYSKKIEDMNDWLTLKDLTRLRGFLGLTGYYICKKLWQNCEPSNTIIEKKKTASMRTRNTTSLSRTKESNGDYSGLGSSLIF